MVPKKDESKSQEMASPLLVLWRREADAHKVLTRITSIRLHRYHQSDYSQASRYKTTTTKIVVDKNLFKDPTILTLSDIHLSTSFDLCDIRYNTWS